MKNYEKIIVIGVLAIIIIINSLSAVNNSKLRSEIRTVGSSIERIESRQREIETKLGEFEKGYVELGTKISGVGGTVTKLGTDIQTVRTGVSGLTKELRNFTTRLPEIEGIVNQSGGRIEEAQRLLQELREGSVQNPVKE